MGYSRISVVTDEAIDAIPHMPTIIVLDGEPDMEELSKTLDTMSSGRSHGIDAIFTEVLKCGIDVLLPHLHTLLIPLLERRSYSTRHE